MEVVSGEERIVLDAGSGIRELGLSMAAEPPRAALLHALPRELQRKIASYLMSQTKRLVLRGTKTYTLYLTVVLPRFVWKLIFR